MKEVKLNQCLAGEVHRRRIFTIKNDKGWYQGYSIKSRWVECIANANMFFSERGAIEEAERMLKSKENINKGESPRWFPEDFCNSFEKVYVVELRLSEVEE